MSTTTVAAWNTRRGQFDAFMRQDCFFVEFRKARGLMRPRNIGAHARVHARGDLGTCIPVEKRNFFTQHHDIGEWFLFTGALDENGERWVGRCNKGGRRWNLTLTLCGWDGEEPFFLSGSMESEEKGWFGKPKEQWYITIR